VFPFLRQYVHAKLLGKTLLSILFRIEDAFPHLLVSFRQACVDEPGTPALAPRIHNSDAFFSPKIDPLAFFFHAVSG
jgi:hypothetical protein